MHNPELDQLHSVVENDEVPMQKRRDAADHLIEMAVEGVPEPRNDDQEVLARMTPWSDGPVKSLVLGISFAKAALGENLADAISEVQKVHRLRSVLAVVVDESAHRLERLAACQWVLANYGHISKWRANNYGAQNLLAEVSFPTATKWTYDGKLPVERPPLELKDVWAL
ncbi:hypothetical protein SAMN05421771_1853 [Granulicella pectinivorans]|uniref:Uncharacterized protein n=1 Tax=Granulicella pectinivorans TaxID=474950 RepID=A0A1I6M528_9BACT|nr:hypothetical protein [Granulicella pectinivorans]SFS10825.1 hypothetical protein SAMN05421771_1853 [Granulicella pectinivorans]